jgi:hypothetical protein
MRRIILISFILCLAGCHGGVFDYKSGVVLESQRIPFPSDNQVSGTWDGSDLRVDYQWIRTGADVRFLGEIRFAGHLRHNYERLDSFHFALIFIGPEGKVLEIRDIEARTEGLETASFDAALHLPGDASHFAFSYQGVASTVDADELDFWNYPIRNW